MTEEISRNDVLKALEELPRNIQEESKRLFLYSSHKTLSPGKYYLLGINPGGNPDTILPDETINWKIRTENAYLDEAWGNHKKGCAPYQLNVQALCNAVGIDIRDVCASNWFFIRSKTAKEIEKKIKPEIFLPVHKAIMKIVQPEVIFAVGLKTYDIVRDIFEFKEIAFEQSDALPPSGHGKWSWFIADRQYEQKKQTLIGFPHFSRYALRCHEDVLSRVVKECRKG